MQRADWIVNATVAAVTAAAGVVMILMMLHIVMDVALRYLFQTPIIGTLEVVSWYYMVCAAFLPVAYVQMNRRHLVVEMFTMGLTRRGMAFLDTLIGILTLIYVGILNYLVIRKAIVSTRQNEIQDATFFDLAIWPSRWILAVSFSVMTIVILTQIIVDGRFALFQKGRPTFERRAGRGADRDMVLFDE